MTDGNTAELENLSEIADECRIVTAKTREQLATLHPECISGVVEARLKEYYTLVAQAHQRHRARCVDILTGIDEEPAVV